MTLTMNSLSFYGIQYRILTILKHRASIYRLQGFKYTFDSKYLCAVRTVDIRRPDDRILAARNFHIKAWGVRTITTVVRMIELWMHDLPYEWARLGENTQRLDGCNCLPISVFWKEIPLLIKDWTASERAAETFGRMQLGTVRSFLTQRKVGQKVLIVRIDDAWTVERPDVITRRSDGCKGTVLTALNSAQSLLWRTKIKCRLRIT